MATGFAANVALAGRVLEPFRSARVPHRIGGAQTAGSSTFVNVSPVDGSPLGEIAAGTATDVDVAARAARAAQAAWAAVTGERRRALLHRIADLIESRADEIAVVESMDTGQPIRFMEKAAVRGAENFRFYADRAPGARDGEALPTDQHLNYTLRVPIGPVGVITPWNTPFMLATWKVAPALAAGCVVILKPASQTPLSAIELGRIGLDAGLPPGVLQVLPGAGSGAGMALVRHPGVDKIAFTGSTEVGRTVVREAAVKVTCGNAGNSSRGRPRSLNFERPHSMITRCSPWVVMRIPAEGSSRTSSTSRVFPSSACPRQSTTTCRARTTASALTPR